MQQGRAQLQMMLLQQAGSGCLPLTNLSPDALLSFIRDVELLLLEQKLTPAIVYWSSHEAKRLLPRGQRYRELLRDAFCVSVFSEGKSQGPFEFCFLVESRQLSLVIYGHQSGQYSAEQVLQLSGSVDPHVVRQACSKLMPIWQSIDLLESNHLEDALKSIGQPATNPLLGQLCRQKWPVVKVPGSMPAEALPSSAAAVIPPDAQLIIREIIGLLRHSDDVASILQMAIEKLTLSSGAQRGLIWQVCDNELAVTQEYSTTGQNLFVGEKLASPDSAAILLEFVSRFPDDSCSGVISVPDTHQDTYLHKMSPQLASLIELGDVRARLVAQLRCRGKLFGFVELQQCGQTRSWSQEDAHVLQIVAEMLSALVQQEFDQSTIEADAEEMELINKIAGLFRESRGQKSHDVLVESVELVCRHLGFSHAQIYLYSQEYNVLVPQIEDGQTLDLAALENPFVAVYQAEHKRVMKFNVVPSKKGDPFFKHDMAVVVPLVSEGERMGVLGLWSRTANQAELRQKDEDLLQNISGQLAIFIRADQAIAQIRNDQMRGALINRVVSEIKNSQKEVDQLLETLAAALKEYFALGMCVVALFDSQLNDFTKTKSAGNLGNISSPLAPNFGEQIFLATIEELKRGEPVFLQLPEIKSRLSGKGVIVPEEIKMATLVPLVHGEQFKAALCMLSTDRTCPYPDKDMNMVTDLADRVAVVISHAQLYAQVERQAVTDPMTGLYNRRYFNEELSKEIDRFARHGIPFSYIIIDLDFLKKINDTHGHQLGDLAIKHIANVLRRQVRDVDTAARFGGEEFVVLQPVTNAKESRAAAERIRAAIADKPVKGIGTITASLGTATFPTDAGDRDTLAELADQALYLAKHRGRNQVCSVSQDLLPVLEKRGQEALQVQQEMIKVKASEMASLDLKLIAEHGILGIMGAIIKIIEARDAYGEQRSPKAAEFAGKLAHALHLSAEHATIISLAAGLQNMGKIAIPSEILQKPGPLTAEERKLIEQSPVIGAKILEPARHLHRVAAVIEAYHEHWDGSGYPSGLKAEEIPLESRIIALVDAYIAMTSDRPYRKALSNEQAVKEIKNGSGRQWDPRLVKLFLSLLQKETKVASQVPTDSKS